MADKKVAIPLFHGEVAPRFCFARMMLLANITDGEVTGREQLDVSDCGWRVRLTMLADRQVTLLLCGGFNRRYLGLAEGLGMFVSWGHVGAVDPLLEQLCSGTLPRPTIHCGQGFAAGRERRRGRRRGGGHSSKR